MPTQQSVPVISHSQIAMFRDCQKRYDYRYRQHLVPVRKERPLYLGNWVHRCLETHYGQGDWKIGHAEYLADYDKLFDEERLRLDRGNSKRKNDDDLEPLPSQVKRIMESYLWYNRNERIKTIATEVKFQLPVPVTTDGETLYILTGVIDHIYEDEDGLVWIRDHKTVDEIPDEQAFHTIDPQTTIYIHGAREALGVEAAGIEFNYVRSSPPTIPKLTQKGAISEAAISTDYPTVYRFLKANGRDPADFIGLLTPLAHASPFLARYRLPKTEAVTARILADADQTAREIMAFPPPVRNITRRCNWCPYSEVCRGELFDVDTSYLRRKKFTVKKEQPVPAGT